MGRRLKLLLCRWYGHDWALATACQRACLDDVCFRCGANTHRHATEPRYCTHRQSFDLEADCS